MTYDDVAQAVLDAGASMNAALEAMGPALEALLHKLDPREVERQRREVRYRLAYQRRGVAFATGKRKRR